MAVLNTNPEVGLFRKGEHKLCFPYSAYAVCDRNSFVPGAEVHIHAFSKHSHPTYFVRFLRKSQRGWIVPVDSFTNKRGFLARAVVAWFDISRYRSSFFGQREMYPQLIRINLLLLQILTLKTVFGGSNMSPEYQDLQTLLQQVPQAKQYFDSLPDYVKDQICTRPHNINSVESLRNYAEIITRGDH